MVQGVVIDAQGQPVDGAKVTIEQTEGVDPQVRDEDRQEGRVHPDRPAVGRLQGHRREGQARRRDRQHVASASAVRRACGSSSAAARGSDPAEARPRPPSCGRRSTKASPLSRAGKHDDAIAKFNKALGGQPELLRLLLQHRLRVRRRRRTTTRPRRLQEGDRAEAGLRRGLQRARERLQRAAQVRRGRRGEREGERADGAAAPGGLAGGNADALYNQGVILWNAGKIAEAKKRSRQAIAANPNHAEVALSARHGARERRQAGRRPATEFETYLKLAPTARTPRRPRRSSRS